MYYPITEKKEVAKLNQTIFMQLEEQMTEKVAVSVGYQSNSEFHRVTYSESLGIWWYTTELDNRYWNIFGIGRPTSGQNLSITCEINIPLQGFTGRIAAIFARNEKNEIVMLHSGKIGGGRPGIGKSLFQDNYTGSFVDLAVNNEIKKYAAIGAINTPRFARQISEFVKEIGRIKNLTTMSSKGGSGEISTEFKEEFFGDKKISPQNGSLVVCDHGVVVNSLKKILMSKGYMPANDIFRDLYILGPNRSIRKVFEVKTSLDTQSIYTAVGQLIIHNNQFNPIPEMILVLPGMPNSYLKKAIDKAGIKIIEYCWNNDLPVFKGLDT